ncbi:MAG: hypothetical protein IJJ61_07275 [Clostridia bacterium]|nr:hypothetical protein [Clostridia bacterium]
MNRNENRKLISVFSVVALILASCSFFSGCSKNSSPVDPVANVQIDYGESEIYSKEDMDAAIELIKAEFSTWKGCTLKKIYYVSDDECSEQNVNDLNEIEASNDNKEVFTQCIMFESDFHTPKRTYLDQLVDFNSFEEDEDYIAWQWWLGRSETGNWKLVTWGY